jgi:hypothetical protein
MPRAAGAFALTSQSAMVHLAENLLWTGVGFDADRSGVPTLNTLHFTDT